MADDVMADDLTVDDLTELEQLRAENAALRVSASAPPNRHRGRRWGSVVLLVIAAILMPPALVGAWVTAELANADQFVATMAPVGRDPAVQHYLEAKISTGVVKGLNLDALTKQITDGLAGVLPPRAAAAAQSLTPAANNAVHGLVQNVVTRFIGSKDFPAQWDTVMRATHTQLTGVLQGSSTQAVVADANGRISIQLGPIIAKAKQRLEAAGFGAASAIPAANITIPVASVDGLSQARTVYAVLLPVGAILPWVVLGCLVVGILIAPARSRAVLLAGLLVSIASAVLLLALVIGQAVAVPALSPAIMPAAVAQVVLTSLTSFLVSSTLAVLLIGLIMFTIGLTLGPSTGAAAVRREVSRPLDSVRRGISSWSFVPTRFGRGMRAARPAILAVIVAIAVVVLAFLRPITPGEVFLTFLGAAVVALLATLLESPGRPAPLPSTTTTATAVT